MVVTLLRISLKESTGRAVKGFRKYSKRTTTGLKLYDKVTDELLKYGIESLVTISYYEMPLTLSARVGQLANRKLVEFFRRYCVTLFV